MATIRGLRPDDWSALRAIRLLALQSDPSAFGSTLAREEAATEEQWRQWLASAAFFVAAEDGQDVGVVLGRRTGDGAAELNALWVAPEYRSAGIGAALTEAVLAWAAGAGCTRVGLWVTAGNAAATRLYEALGFADDGRREPLESDPQLTKAGYSRAL